MLPLNRGGNISEEKSKTGRKERSDKKIITSSDVERIGKLSAMGLSIGEIADFFGMHRDTFYQRCSENPDILPTVKAGKAEAKSNLLGKSYIKAMGDKEDPESGDNDMLKFILARVHGLSEKQVLEHKVKNPDEDYTEAELRERIMDLEKKNECLKQIPQTMQDSSKNTDS